jgi:hypothetical protein
LHGFLRIERVSTTTTTTIMPEGENTHLVARWEEYERLVSPSGEVQHPWRGGHGEGMLRRGRTE